jgi:DNA replication protein DnaC
MTYGKEVFALAEAEINRRHVSALAVNEKRILEIERCAPEIAALNRSLINTSIELSKAIMKGDKDITFIVRRIREENLIGQEQIKELLSAFGYSQDYLDISFTCKKCNDTGYVNGVRCECFDELLRKFSIIELNKNCKIKLTCFDDFRIDYYPDEIDKSTGINPREKMTSNFNACRDFVNMFSKTSKSIFMNGSTGLGKTFLSAAIANELLKKGFSVAFDTSQN